MMLVYRIASPRLWCADGRWPRWPLREAVCQWFSISYYQSASRGSRLSIRHLSTSVCVRRWECVSWRTAGVS